MLQGFWNFGFSWPAVNSGVLILLQHMLTRPPIWAPILVVDYLLLDVYDVRGSNISVQYLLPSEGELCSPRGWTQPEAFAVRED